MKKWLRRIRGTIGMGLTWAAGWAVVGMLIELIQEIVPGWNGAIVDIWPAALAYPAFFGGVAFSVVLRIAGRRRRFEKMSLPRFAAWGALGGLAVSISIVTALGATPPSLIAAGVVTLLCAGSAAGSLALARMAEERGSLDPGSEVAEVGLTGDEAQELPAGRG